MAASAFITGVGGPTLTAAERSFLREAQPWALILFKRNIDNPAQVLRLTASFREAVGRNAAVLVDQEGGRVQRLGPPHWPLYPPAAEYGRCYDCDPAAGVEAAKLGSRLIAADLRAVGIDVDCLPVADLRLPGASSIIGDRAYGNSAGKVAALARAAAEGLLSGGILPVLKHLPGHGRATVDSHEALPVVDAARARLAETDFAAFRPLCDLPLGMTAHVVYSAIDPIAPATTSVTVVGEVIRDRLGFSGLLMTDDISMRALSGSIAELSRAAIAAGCDVVLHCNGAIDEMREVAGAVPRLSGASAARAEAALGRRGSCPQEDVAAMRLQWRALMDDARRAAS